MFDTPLDYSKLHKELRYIYKRQQAIKKEFPHRYQPQPWEDYLTKRVLWNKRQEEVQLPWRDARAEFDKLSQRMTMLCCILNHSKGKLHMTTWNGAPFDLKKQSHFVRNEWTKYIKEDDHREVA